MTVIRALCAKAQRTHGTTANLCINTTFDKNLQNYCKDFVIGIRLHLTRLAVILEPVNVQFCAFYLFDAILLKIKGEFDYDDFSS